MRIEMGKFKYKVLTISMITLGFVLFSQVDLFAQCAMCKASVETNVNVDGIGLASRLNTGILYLFVTPYLLAMVIGYFWYRKSREQRRIEEEAYIRKQRIAGL
jgi:hypothetical protein